MMSLLFVAERQHLGLNLHVERGFSHKGLNERTVGGSTKRGGTNDTDG